MERPTVVYGRYYYGQEIIRDVTDLHPLNENNHHSLTAASEYNRQINNENSIGNSQRTREAIQGIGGANRGSHYNVDDYGNYVAGPSFVPITRNHNCYGHAQPPFGARHRDFSRQPIQGSVGPNRGSHFNVYEDGNYVAGPSTESTTRNHHSYVHPQPPFGVRHSDFSRGSVGTSRGSPYDDADGNYVAEPSYVSITRNHHGYGHPQQSSGAGHRLNRQPIYGSVDTIRSTHNVDHHEEYVAGPSSARNTLHLHGYHQPQFGGHHRDLGRQGNVGRCTVDVDENYETGPSFGSDNHKLRGYEHPQPPFGSRHRDFSHQGIRLSNPVYDNDDESSSTYDNERNKLIKRITRYYEELLPLVYSKNIDRFNKPDWLKMSFISRNGMKIFEAEMFCPLCFGKISPQNKEKEAGRVPKWDLYAVKRHLILVHKVQKIEGKVNDVNGTTANEKRKIGKIAPVEETIDLLEDYESIGKLATTKDSLFEKKEENIEEIATTEETIGLIEKKEETIEKMASTDKINGPFEEKTDLFEVQNKLPDKKIDSLDGINGDEEEKSGAKNFVPYLSLAASSDSESISDSSSDTHSNSSESETATKNVRGTKKPRKKIVKRKQKSARTRKQSRSSPQPKSSGSKRRKIKQSSSESEPEMPDWRKPNVIFGWVKLTTASRFQPGFIFPKRKNEKKHTVQYIKCKGTLSDLHQVENIATPAEVEHAKKSKKSYSHLCAIKKFNALNHTNFQ